MSLVRVKKLYKVRYIMREPTELDAALDNPVATITKTVEAWSRWDAWEICRVELGLSKQEARHWTREGVPVLSVEEL